MFTLKFVGVVYVWKNDEDTKLTVLRSETVIVKYETKQRKQKSIYKIRESNQFRRITFYFLAAFLLRVSMLFSIGNLCRRFSSALFQRRRPRRQIRSIVATQVSFGLFKLLEKKKNVKRINSKPITLSFKNELTYCTIIK